MAIRYPIEYDLSPRKVEAGRRWLTLNLKNIGTKDLTLLDVRLNSLDVYALNVLDTGKYIPSLVPNEEKKIPFQVSADISSQVYVTINGLENSSPFYWESPAMILAVGQEVAELTSVFAMTAPYSLIGKTIHCEATVRSLTHNRGLNLQIWASTPSEEFIELLDVETDELPAGEVERYTTEFTPEERGMYTIYAYLYNNGNRIGRRLDEVYVQQA